MNSAATLVPHFSFKLGKTIWKTLADPLRKRLFIEIRDKEDKRVSFSMLDMDAKEWAWRNVTFDEPWWISLNVVSGNTLVFTVYDDHDNPDKKSIIAYDVVEQQIKWWKQNFVVAFVSERTMVGVDTKFGSKEIVLDLQTGEPIKIHDLLSAPEQNFPIIRPFQYLEESDHFKTVSAFIERKCDFLPVFSVEYVEHQALIFISAYEGRNDLANYLFVFNSKGDLVLKETLGEELKGIANGTFFIIPGYLIFVKNKSELVSYRIV